MMRCLTRMTKKKGMTRITGISGVTKMTRKTWMTRVTGITEIPG